MPENSVTTTFFADEKAAQAAIVRLEKKYADLENRLKQVSKRSRQGSDEAIVGLGRWTGQLTSMAAGYLALPALIGSVIAANKQMIDQADQAALKYDALFRRFRVQTGLGTLAGEEAQKRIQNLAVKNALPVEFASAAATQLVSSGFTAEEGSGAALDVLLKTIQASNLGGGDPTQLAQSFGQFLGAQGLEKNAENLQRVAVAVQRLFKGTDLQVSDLSQLAARSQTAVGRASIEEQLGVFDVLREKTTADKASTAFQALFDRLTGFVGDPVATKALRGAGLKPGDVDLVGESVSDALDRLAAGAERLPEEKRAAFFQDLFGREVGGQLQGLVRDRGKIADAVKILSDTKGFEEDVAIATSGKAAGRTRGESAEEVLASALDVGIEDYFKARRLVARARGDAPFATDINEKLLRASFYLNPPEVNPAIEEAEVSKPGEFAHDVKRVMEAMQQSNSELLKVLEEIRDNTRGRSRREEPGAS